MREKHLRDKFLLIVALLSFVQSQTPRNARIQYAIKEESNIGSFIGNLRIDSEYQLPTTDKSLTFKLYDETTGLFRLEENTGKLFIAKRVDRETICPGGSSAVLFQNGESSADINYMKFTSPGTDEDFESLDSCQLTLTIFVAPEYWINAVITIQDINDNEPKFLDADTTPEYSINISESVDENYSVPLVGAIDEDVGINSIQRYTLEGTEIDPNVFAISFQKPYNLNLIVLKKLDAEIKESYSGQLKACDGGFPKPKCGTRAFVINVSDVNDNMPIFKQKVYNVTISEDEKVGFVVAKVEADDLDVGVNGNVRYEIGQGHDRLTSSQFGIKPNTGEVFLRSALNAREHSKFEIALKAIDGGNIPRIGHAKLIVNVQDVNNNRPWIKVSPMSIPDNVKSTALHDKKQLYIEENRSESSLVGLIVAGDDDLGANGAVECNLKEGSKDFELTLSNSAKNKQVFSLTNKVEFDREKSVSGKIPIKVRCIDKGTPALTTDELFDVNIVDINEFPPIFPSGFAWYTSELLEDVHLGTFVFQVQASDNDSTAELHYELTPEAQNFFRIDSKSGRVYTSANLDREKQPEIKFEIIVTDKTNMSSEENVDDESYSLKSARASASVTILDVNDNKPQLRAPREFEFFENEPAYTEPVGQLIALDPDNGENGTVKFSLLSVQSSDKIISNNTFMLDSDSGKLYVQENLDRENIREYTLKIQLTDCGSPPLSEVDYVIVKVLDVNDNSPNWKPITNTPYVSSYVQNVNEFLKKYKSSRLGPSSDVYELGLLNISAPLTPGQRILQLSAEDMDEGENANKTYYLTSIKLLDGNLFQTYRFKPTIKGELQFFLRQFFSVSQRTGEVTASAGPDSQAMNCDAIFEIWFRVDDNGKPQKSSTARLFVIVIKGNAETGSSFYSSNYFFSKANLSFNLIILMVSLTCLISLCLLIAIIIVRKRATKDRLARGRRRRLLNQNGMGTIANGMEINGSNDLASVHKWARDNVYIPGPFMPPPGTIRQYMTPPPLHSSSEILHENGNVNVEHVGYYSVNSPLMNGCNTDSLVRKPHSPTHTQVSQLGSFQSWSNKSSN